MGNRFWFVGGHLAVDFANTVIGTDLRQEALDDWAGVLGFLVEAGALGEAEARRLAREARRERAGAGALAAALSLRQVVRDLVAALASGRPAHAGAVRRLNAELASAAATHPRLVGEDQGWRLEALPLDRSWRGLALGPIACAAADLLAHPDGSVRKCANPGCLLFFRDGSQAQARRWCSMSVCGNRAKVAAHARRARSTLGRSAERGPARP